MSKSAVEWLQEQIAFISHEGEILPKFSSWVDLKEYFKKSKEMEAAEKKDIVIKAFNAGNQDNFYNKDGKAAEKYYNDNYGTERTN